MAIYMVNKSSPDALGAKDPGLRVSDYPLGSPQSRAAARALLEARKASEESELHFVAVSILDGSPLNFDGLAETIRAGRMRARGEESFASLPASESGRECNEGRSADCLSERIRMARERLRRVQGPETMA